MIVGRTVRLFLRQHGKLLAGSGWIGGQRLDGVAHPVEIGGFVEEEPRSGALALCA
jgi:hypothetical protein